MAKRKRQQGPIQRLITDHLASKPVMTPYRLAKLCGWVPKKAYDRLSGTVQLARIEEVLKALGGQVTIGRGRGRRTIKF